MARCEYRLLTPAIARYSYRPKSSERTNIRPCTRGIRWALKNGLATPKYITSGDLATVLIHGNITLLQQLPRGIRISPEEQTYDIGIALNGGMRHDVLHILRQRFGCNKERCPWWAAQTLCRDLLALRHPVIRTWKKLLELRDGYGISHQEIKERLDDEVIEAFYGPRTTAMEKRIAIVSVLRTRAGL